MAYRILKVTTSFYRIWASVRMRNLEKWIGTWADDAMFAGVPGSGAEEAWYLTQLEFELDKLTGRQISAGSIDIYKCFDQLLRPLIVSLAKEAGMPQNILKAYQSFNESLLIRMQIGATLGKAHHHRCSIPQGCPFSMMFIAF